MRIAVTGSSGHLGEALMRMAAGLGHTPVGIDLVPSPHTHLVGDIADPAFAGAALDGVEAVLHTATLHKPHVATHSKQDFIATNVSGTLNLLEAALRHGLQRFVFTSTTSAFGAALVPAPGAPAAWITEDLTPIPKNIYGATKTAAEDLCHLFHRRDGLNVVILRTSRFFPEADDDPGARARYTDQNTKANELLFRRFDVADAAMAHFKAVQNAAKIGFGRYIVSATSPFQVGDLAALAENPVPVVARYYPDFQAIYAARGYEMFPSISRVYVNAAARRALDWTPEYDFAHALRRISQNQPIGSDLSRAIGAKGYHDQEFDGQPYPVE